VELSRRIPLVLGLIDMPAAGATLQPPVRIERIVKGRHADALHRCAGGRTTDVSGQFFAMDVPAFTATAKRGFR
jgi:hypothetical protein